MATALFIVIQSRGKWHVDFEGRSQGPYDTIELAALEARKQAMFQASLGRPSEVMVPDKHGKYWSIWDSRKAGVGPTTARAADTTQPSAPASESVRTAA